MQRGDHPWAGYRVVFGVRRYYATKEKSWVIMEFGHLRSRQGLGPLRPLLFAVVGVGGTVRKKGRSLLGPFGLPRWGSLPLLLSPAGGEASFFSSSSSRVESALESSDDESDNT